MVTFCISVNVKVTLTAAASVDLVRIYRTIDAFIDQKLTGRYVSEVIGRNVYL